MKSLERIKRNESFKNAIELDIEEIAINFKEKYVLKKCILASGSWWNILDDDAF